MRRSAGILGIACDPEGAAEIANRSRGTPRIANRLLRRVRDYAQVRAGGNVGLSVATCLIAVWLGHILAAGLNQMKGA